MKTEIDVQKLFEVAGEHSEELVEELIEFNRFLNANYKLKIFLENNNIKPAKRIEILKEVSKGRSKLFKDFIGLLTRNGIMRDVSMLTEKFAMRVSKNRDVDFAELYVSRAVDDTTMEHIRDHFGRRIRIRVTVDPKIIGGFTLKFFDGRVYDASIAGGLDKLRAEIVS